LQDIWQGTTTSIVYDGFLPRIKKAVAGTTAQFLCNGSIRTKRAVKDLGLEGNWRL